MIAPLDHSLRPIVLPADQEFLIRVYADTRASEMALVPWTDAQKDAFVRSQFDTQHRAYTENYPLARFSVILHGERPVGRLYVDRSPGRILIIDIALLAGEQKQGIGTALLNDLIAESAQTGCPIHIHVEQFNPALRWYQTLGFQSIDLHGIYYLMIRPPDPIRS